MKRNLILTWVVSMWFAASAFAQNHTQTVTGIHYFFDTDPGVGVPGNGAILSVTPTSNYVQSVAINVPNTLTAGFHNLYIRARDEFGQWSLAERRLFYINSTLATQDLTHYHYYFDTDPGVGEAGNGAIVPITQTSDYNTSVSITVPNTLTTGFHRLYIRTRDVLGRWSLAERRLFYINPALTATQDLIAYQYFFDTDPGVAVAGNGAIVSVPQTSDFDQTVSITVPNTLSTGFHHLYIRTKDVSGRWSLIERRPFYINSTIAATQDIDMYQYYFDTDPGVGVAGNGAIVPVAQTADFDQTVSITVPNTLSTGFHHLYIRTRDIAGRWSLIERRPFYINSTIAATQDIDMYHYYFDTDPGVGVAGNGAIVPVPQTSDFDQSISITIPNTLTTGFHRLYLRTRDISGRWSLIERRSFYINSEDNSTQTVTALEFYYDSDPGVGNGNPIPVDAAADIDAIVPIGVPCLSTGTHYLYVRAIDEYGRWSIIGRDTLDVTSGISAAVVTPAGPLNICVSESVNLSASFVPEVEYQWLLDGDEISGATTNEYVATTAGNYSLRSTCGSSFVTSNVVSVSVVPQVTYYADADDDSYGDAAISTLACSPPEGYVTNDDDCDDTNTNIHPGATEVCNLIDDDCDGSVDEGVQTTYYADADMDGFGTPSSTVVACSPPSGFVANNDDCDDDNENVNPNVTEVCNLIDDDCDGSVDEGVQNTYYADSDSDGFGNPAVTQLACTQPSGYVANSDDCNDGNINVHPGATETCNGMDDDCDGMTDDADPSVSGQSTWYADTDNDGYGTTTSSLLACTQPAGYVSNDDDCDDGNMNVNPGATETCNGMDDDCDGLADDADPSVSGQSTWYADTDTDGYGDPASSLLSCYQPSGYVSNNDDCDDDNEMVNPMATEVCNTIDDDCDGEVDEGVQLTFYADADNDGYGNAANPIQACTQPSGYVANADDCNDVIYTIYPGATELCNGVDDDCDTEIDEGFEYSVPATSISSSDGTNFCSGTSTLLSVIGGSLGSGAVWKWYEGGCGSGSSIGTGSSISVTPAGGVHTYYVRAEGICNASACTSLSVTVNTTPSFTTCPANSNVSIDATLCSATRSYTVVSSGIPVPALTYSFSGATTGSGSGTGSGSVFNKGTTTVTVTADNLCGSAVCSFSITVNDTEDPVISGCPSAIDAVVEEGQWGAHVTWTEPTATDNCAMESLTSTHTPGDFFNVGSTVVTYTAMDESGNSSLCQFYITVTPPDLVGKVNLSIFVNDIMFSDDNPDPGSTVNISAVVHNNSNVDASGFDVRLLEMFSNTAYPLVTVPALGANQTTQVNWVINTPNVAAFVPIQVAVDFLDDLDEESELDNTAVKPFICGVPESLGTLGVGTNPVPASVPAGSVIQLCGSAFYENVLPPLLDPSVAGAELTITITETGESISGYTDEDGNFCISYHTSNTPGLYHYTVEVTDNTLGGDASGSFTLTTPPPPPCLLDLSVSIGLTGITPDPYGNYTVVVGTSFSGTVYVHNGCEEVTLPTTLFIGLPNGTPVPGPFVIPALLPGETYAVPLPTMTLTIVGNSYISATVDYFNVVAEDYETNNTAYKSIRILSALPDIAVVAGGVLSDYFCQPGNQVMFVVRNIGPVASGSFNAVFEFYGNNILQSSETESISNLDPQESTTLIFPFTPAFLVDSFELTVDTPNVVSELSELNNRMAFPYVFQPCEADLVVLGCEYADVKPADPVPAGTLTVTAMIQNRGQLSVTAPFDVEFDVAGTIVSVPVNGPLAAGQIISLSASAPAPVTIGDFVSVTADPADVIEEEYESNNGFSAILCHDFEFTNSSCAGDLIFRGTQYYCNSGVFRIGLWNFGVYEASDLKVKFEISGPGLPPGWVDLGTVSKYMGNSCNCPDVVELPNSFYFPAVGLYEVRITLDPDNDYPECNESNGQIVMGLNVVESVDYRILSSYITPSDLNPDINEVVSFNVSYENDGCTGFSPMELYAQVDNDPLDSVIVSALSGGGFNTVAIPNTWSSSIPGIHVFRAIIDHDEQFSEGNELNNEATKAIIVGEAPDYRVIGVSSTDTTPVFGQLLTLTASVHNDGQSTGSGMLQFLYADVQNGEVLIDQVPISILPGNTIVVNMDWIAVAPNARIIARVINVTPVESDFSDNEKDLQLNNLSVDINSTDVVCSGFDLGSMEVVITGGQPPYFIQWSTGQTDETIDVPSGMYSVQVTDLNGLTYMAYDTILDQAIPTTYYQDADGDAFGNPDSTLYVCDPPEDYVGTGTDCDDTDATVYPDAPEVADAQDNDCDGSIDEGISFLSVDAGDCETVYLGYAPAACYDLTVLAEGGALPYSYQWSNGATTPTTTVCPEETTIYTIVVTDNNGFTAQDVVTVQVIDIRCGNNNDKVLVCHIPPGNPENVQMICISQNAVAAHLAEHGDYIGICDAPDPCSEEGQSYGDIHIDEVYADEDHHEVSYDETAQDDPLSKLTLVPNPADNFVIVKLPDIESEYEVCMFDITGKLIQKHKYAGGDLRISTEELANGMYMIQFRSPEKRMTKGLVILH